MAALVKEKQSFFKLWRGPKKCKKGCRCEKTGGRKLCGRSRKAGMEGCSVDMETRRQDFNQARGEAKRAIFKAKMMRGRGFARTWRERMRRAICLEWPSD